MPALHGAEPFSELGPLAAIATVVESPATVPHAPPTDVTVVLVAKGKVRALPLTFVSVTVGNVRSTVTVWAPVVPVLAAVSVWVAVIVYAPLAESAVAGVKIHVPAVQVPVPFCVLAPVIETAMLLLSPVDSPQVPPTVETVALLMYGNVRVVLLTLVSATTGMVLSTVIDCAPLVPTLLAVSVCVAVTAYPPSAESAVAGVNVQAPVVQAAVPFCVLAPRIATDTVGLTPAAVVHAPPTVATVAFVVYGNVRTVPLTVVSVTAGAAVLMVIACAPLLPTLLAVSVCVAVTV